MAYRPCVWMYSRTSGPDLGICPWLVVGLMGKYSILVDGTHRDLAFRHKRPIVLGKSACVYSVYVGEKLWGQVFDMGRSWTAVANKPGELNLMDGFATRLDAAFYITKYMQSGEGCSIHDAPHVENLSRL